MQLCPWRVRWTIAALFLAFSWGPLPIGRADDDAAPGTATQEAIARVIPLKFRDPDYLAEILRILPVTISADMQTHRLIALGRPDDLKQVEDLVRELDVPIERTAVAPELELRVYRLRNRTPQELLDCLEPMLSPRGKISGDPTSRTLIIKDDPGVHTDITMLVRELDVAGATPKAPAALVALSSPVSVAVAAPVADHPARTPEPAHEPAVFLRVRVCEIQPQALRGLTGLPGDPRPDSALAALLRGGAPATLDDTDLATCDALVRDGVLRPLAECTVSTPSGHAATLLAGDSYEAPVVEEDEVDPSTVFVPGLCADLRFEPTVIAPGHLLLHAQPIPGCCPPCDQGETGAHAPAEYISVELDEGRTFAMRGRIARSRQAEKSALGGIPLLGALLPSRPAPPRETELLVLVSAAASQESGTAQLALQPSRPAATPTLHAEPPSGSEKSSE